jgi:hypothetical protein
VQYSKKALTRLLFFNGYKSNKIEYLSYESGNIIEPPVEFLDNTEVEAESRYFF